MSEETKGQQNRKNIQIAIESILHRYCPNTYSKMANFIAYDFHLSPDTIKYRYLSMFLDVGILSQNHDGLLVLSEKGQELQTTEDNEESSVSTPRERKKQSTIFLCV